MKNINNPMQELPRPSPFYMPYPPKQIPYGSIVQTRTSQFMPTPSASCAFHAQHTISHFCNSRDCLLPLCDECLVLHAKEHNESNNGTYHPSTLSEVLFASKEQVKLHENMLLQAYSLIESKFMANQDEHVLLKDNIKQEQAELIKKITAYYQGLLLQINDALEQRHEWVRQFREKFNVLMKEFRGFIVGFNDERFLRNIILWNKQSFSEQINNVAQAAKIKFNSPLFTRHDIGSIMNGLMAQNNVAVVEMLSDFGLDKIIYLFDAVRSGRSSNSNSLRQSRGVKKRQKLSLSKDNSHISTGSNSVKKGNNYQGTA